MNVIKTLKFRPHLCAMILRGEKTTTWRLFDDKDIHSGDSLSLIHYETKEEFAKAIAIGVWEKSFGQITEEELDGHEKFSSKEEMYETYSKYYGRTVDDDTIVKIIRFRLL